MKDYKGKDKEKKKKEEHGEKTTHPV